MKCRPSGRNRGPPWPTSWRDAIQTRQRRGAPPRAETRSRPPSAWPSTMTSSRFQAAPPHPRGTSPIACGAPPSMSIFFSLPPLPTNPMNRLSPDQMIELRAEVAGARQRTRLARFERVHPDGSPPRRIGRLERDMPAIGRHDEVAPECRLRRRGNLEPDRVDGRRRAVEIRQRQTATTAADAGHRGARQPHAPAQPPCSAGGGSRGRRARPRCPQPAIGVLLEAAPEQRLHARRHAAPVRLLVEHRADRVGHAVGGKRRSARHHLVQHDAERPDVGARSSVSVPRACSGAM